MNEHKADRLDPVALVGFEGLWGRLLRCVGAFTSHIRPNRVHGQILFQSFGMKTLMIPSCRSATPRRLLFRAWVLRYHPDVQRLCQRGYQLSLGCGALHS